MIVNIHGFESSGENSNYKWLKENYQCEIYSPTFDYRNTNPRIVLKTLRDKINAVQRADASEPVCIVGSSLGGFFANILSVIFPNARTVMLNPSLLPFLTLGKKHDLPVWIRKEYASLVAEYVYEHPSYDNVMVLLSDEDEEINHEVLTLPMLPKSFRNVHTVHATHRMEISEEIGDMIKKFLG